MKHPYKERGLNQVKKLILVLLLLLLILGFQLQFGLTEAANKESENQCKVIT